MSHDLTKARRKPGPGHAWGEGQLTPALGHGVLALGQQQQELASPLGAGHSGGAWCEPVTHGPFSLKKSFKLGQYMVTK